MNDRIVEHTESDIRSRLLMSRGAQRHRRLGTLAGNTVLITIASSSLIALLFIFYFIVKDAIPFFQIEGIKEFFTSSRWYPSREDAEFGALAIFVGSALVTLGAIVVAVPMGVLAALCLSDILPFSVRQVVKPVIEMLAAIPSVVYGFFALVVFAPLLQEKGGGMLSVGAMIVLVPLSSDRDRCCERSRSERDSKRAGAESRRSLPQPSWQPSSRWGSGRSAVSSAA